MAANLKNAEHHVQQAIEWMVLLRSGEATPADLDAFDAWRAADARHDAVLRQIEGAASSLTPLRGAGNADSVHRTLQAPVSRRYVLGTALALVGASLGGAFLVRERTDLLADVRTGTGERRRVLLADGSTVHLNARSAIDEQITDQVRRVRLRSGQALVSVAADARSRPFSLTTPFGDIAALGGRFLVQLLDSGTRVDVLESSVHIRTAAGSGPGLRVDAGASAWFDQRAATVIAGNPVAEAAWVDGLLEMNNQPLARVIDALRPYHRGIIVLDPALASLRVSGLYQLDDPDTALDSLEKSLPLRIKRHTRYWITIGPA